MSFDLERLYALMPTVYRNKDAERGYPLKALLSVLVREINVIELGLDQLYDDQFIETCAEWVIPYIGDLVGAQGLDPRWKAKFSRRAQVANTLAYRRRKGTAVVIEQIAHDITGYGARAVEFFKLLDTTQYMNHIRRDNLAMPDLRHNKSLALQGTPFEVSSHTLDVRKISSCRGKYNIPNIGLFLWRLRCYSLTDSPAVAVGDGCYTFSPLGNDIQIFSQGRTKSDIDISQLAEPSDIPMELSQRMLENNKNLYYDNNGRNCSLFIRVEEDGKESEDVQTEDIVVCDLSDANGGGWAYHPGKGMCAVDPVRGRLALNADNGIGAESPRVYVSYHYGFSADIGGGEYERLYSFDLDLLPVFKVSHDEKNLRGYLPSISDALTRIQGGGVVEINDSGRYEEDLTIIASGDSQIELRAANKTRPHLSLKSILSVGQVPMLKEETAVTLNNEPTSLHINESEVSLNGLLISKLPVHIIGGINKLRLSHCTLVPGLSLDAKGNPISPGQPSLIVDSGTSVEIDSCVLGRISVSRDAHVRITNSILDASDESNVAYSGLDGSGPGGVLYIENCTIIGKVHALELELASNTIFYSKLKNKKDWMAPVWVENRQKGCVRFSYLPLDSIVPRKYSCQPDMAQRLIEESLHCPDGKIDDNLRNQKTNESERVKPIFNSIRYGQPDYCQLSLICAMEIARGADDESEMGVFHDLYNPQRETSLRLLLDEYLRFGLELGIFYES